MGQPVNHTIQCVLLLNVFMEKAFLILWAWYFILAAFTFANITTWFYGYLSAASAEHFIFNHLEMSGELLFDEEPAEPKRNRTFYFIVFNLFLIFIEVQFFVRRFINKYLRTDGMFILRMIAQHADVVFTTELIYKMWRTHYGIERQRE